MEGSTIAIIVLVSLITVGAGSLVIAYYIGAFDDIFRPIDESNIPIENSIFVNVKDNITKEDVNLVNYTVFELDNVGDRYKLLSGMLVSGYNELKVGNYSYELILQKPGYYGIKTFVNMTTKNKEQINIFLEKQENQVLMNVEGSVKSESDSNIRLNKLRNL